MSANSLSDLKTFTIIIVGIAALIVSAVTFSNSYEAILGVFKP